uniref:Uncharacterized protein n=1 Tax=Ditylenchus dipsaci TaxID=166011 RepID=A0A915E1J1_9BILA
MPKKDGRDLVEIHELSEDLSPPTYLVEEDQSGNLVNKVLKVKFPMRPAKGRYSLAHYLRNRSKALGYSVSPPTYRVEEDENGNLVNKDLKVVYPQYPKKGRFSLTNYLKKKEASRGRPCKKKSDKGSKQRSKSRQEEDDQDEKSVQSEECEKQLENEKRRHRKKCRCACGQCCCNPVRRNSSDHACRHQKSVKNIKPDKVLQEVRPSDSIATSRANNSSVRMASVTQFITSMPIPENLTGTFAGARSSQEIEQMLMPTQFLLYYLRPEAILSIDDIPLSEPLTIAYRASDYKVAHYKVRYFSTKSGEKMWSVDMGEPIPKQPSFFSLDKLIQYYKESEQEEKPFQPKKRCEKISPYRAMCNNNGMPSQFTLRWHSKAGFCYAYPTDIVTENRSMKKSLSRLKKSA